LQSGGHDANVISRYSDLEYRLRTYTDYPWTKDYPEPLKQSRCLYFIFCFFYSIYLFIDQADLPIDPQTERLKIANEENQRLQTELDEMRQKFETLNTRYYLVIFFSDKKKNLIFFQVQDK